MPYLQSPESRSTYGPIPIVVSEDTRNRKSFLPLTPSPIRGIDKIPHVTIDSIEIEVDPRLYDPNSSGISQDTLVVKLNRPLPYGARTEVVHTQVAEALTALFQRDRSLRRVHLQKKGVDGTQNSQILRFPTSTVGFALDNSQLSAILRRLRSLTLNGESLPTEGSNKVK
jgi:hypothetical protein